VAGNASIDSPGSYGSFGSFESNMYPGARGSGNGFVDAMGNLLLCGGIGYSPATDAVG